MWPSELEVSRRVGSGMVLSDDAGLLERASTESAAYHGVRSHDTARMIHNACQRIHDHGASALPRPMG
jgi:hypothetical protein